MGHQRLNENRDWLTSAEVCKKYKITRYTLQNWRKGYFIHYGQKHSYLEAEEGVPCFFNTDVHPQRMEYNPIKVAVWVNKMLARRKEMRQIIDE